METLSDLMDFEYRGMSPATHRPTSPPASTVTVVPTSSIAGSAEKGSQTNCDGLLLLPGSSLINSSDPGPAI